MAEVSYFQKYSQKENHITNNTLLMFRHLYRLSPLKFEAFLHGVFGDDKVKIGVIFQQQTKGSSSIPDAVISQKSINIFIEAKAEGSLYLEQIERHIKTVSDKDLSKGTGILLGLTKEKLSEKDKELFSDTCEEKGIQFIASTYLEVISILRSLSSEYELELVEIINDYEEFLRNSDMLPNPFNMVIFPCGTSWKENIEYGVYYEGANKLKANASYIGIYTNKKITHLGKIKGTVCCKVENGDLVVDGGNAETGSISEEEYNKILCMINNTNYYALGEDFERYYIIEKLYETNIRKTSSGGVMGRRYLDLRDFSSTKLSEDHSMEEIVNFVSNASFT